jgi:hypothetical protein
MFYRRFNIISTFFLKSFVRVLILYVVSPIFFPTGVFKWDTNDIVTYKSHRLFFKLAYGLCFPKRVPYEFKLSNNIIYMLYCFLFIFLIVFMSLKGISIRSSGFSYGVFRGIFNALISRKTGQGVLWNKCLSKHTSWRCHSK